MANPSLSKYDWGITLGLAGGTIGAAGWIFGAAFELVADPSHSVAILDILVVLSGALGVMLTGFFVWCLYLSRRRMSLFFVTEALLGASLVFGTLAILWMHARGVLALAVGAHADHGQPGNEVWETIGRHVPPELVYAVPLLILGMMAAIWWPPSRRRLLTRHTHIQRGTPEGERPWHLPI
jgi:hypothetical protein